MPTAPSPLLGRAPVLAAIGAAARSGRGTVLIGPRGSGGSRLLQEAFSATRRSGLRSARLITPDSAHGARPTFLPQLQQAAAGVLDVVFLDDAHLLDAESGALLAELARAGTAIVANATGVHGTPAPLDPLIEEGLAAVVPLDPLTHDEVAALAAELLGDPIDGDLALALAAASGGRPGTLREVVDDAVGSRSVAHADGMWRLVAPLPPPRSVRTAVLDAFSALPPEHRGWIAAVAQAGLLADDLARRIAAAETIDAADEAGWTVRDSTHAATRIATAPIGAAVLGSLDLRARVAVLRRLVAANEASDRPLTATEQAAVMRWRIEIGLPSDPKEAWRLALLASTDSTTREVLLRAAVEGGAPAGADLADLLRRTRRPAQALELIEAALPGASDERERVALLRVRAMTTGIIERSSADALRALDPHLLDGDPHADLVAVRASMLLMEARPAEAASVAASARALGERSDFAAAFGLMQLSLAHRELGHLEEAESAAGRLLALDQADDGFPDGAALARWLPSELLVAVAAEPLAAAPALAAERDAVPPAHRTTRRPALSYTLASVHLLRGEPDAAARLLREADAGGGAWRDSWLPRILAELAVAQTLSGALDGAAATRDRLRHLTCPPVHRGRVELAAAQLAQALGDAERAVTIASAVAERGARNGMALDAFDGVFAALRYGDPAAPERLLALGPFPSGRGRDLQRRYARALLAGDPHGIDTAATDLWDAGLRLFAIEAASRAASAGSADAAPRVVGWLARTASLRLPGIGERNAAWLTAREREVALLAAQGASDREVAAALGITLRTAQTHLGRALGKLGVHRRTELRGLLVEP